MFQSKIQENQAEIAKLKQSCEDSMMSLKKQLEEKGSSFFSEMLGNDNNNNNNNNNFIYPSKRPFSQSTKV